MSSAAPRLCPVCAAHGLPARRLGPANRTGRCSQCAREKRDGRLCRCGCGKALDARNRSGMARGCLLRLAMRLVSETDGSRVVRLTAPPSGVQSDGK